MSLKYLLQHTASVVLFTLTTTILHAQVITGFVADDKGEPAIGATVYFDGTTIGTTTNASGYFSINPKATINSALVVSYMGYETVVISNPFETKVHSITLTPKPLSIREVTIVSDPFTHEEMLKAFKREFLGTNWAGKRCNILNEEDIELFYDYGSNRLEARSLKPLLIDNRFLGYMVNFDLVDFYIKFNKRTLKKEFMHSSLFLGTSLFTEYQAMNRRHARRRDDSYKGSQLNFFRDLSQMKWGKEGFILFSGSYPTLPSGAFEVKDTLGLKMVTLLPNPDAPKIRGVDGKEITPSARTFNLLYNNKHQSMVKFSTTKFFIDSHGNNSHPHQISFGGDMGKRRFGNLLPLDYNK